ncbi:MAG: helix-turn-helix domain-containing protein [Verrucomicrobiales bacterium]
MSKSLVESVAECVKRLRRERGISQEDLAERADLDRTYISGIERAVRNISLNSLSSIIRALGLTTKEFLKELQKDL